jgi:adenosylcobalamin-dependent ribonucleoside-triphosphate reductase
MSKYIKFGNMFNYLVYKRTYARRFNDHNNITEEWGNSIDRVINGCKTQLKISFNPEEEYSLRYNMENFRATVAGRYLFQLGTKTVDKIGYGSLMNCMYIDVDNINVFGKVFNWLMLGTGVGFGVMPYHINKLPIVIDKNINIIKDNSNNNAYFVEDSREGWVDLLNKTIDAHFITGNDFVYNTTKIRPRGANVAFGGLSSGDEELIKMISEVNKILNINRGLKLKDINVLDLICNISSCVVSGNVRRSALISLGSSKSYSYLTAKRWSSGNIPNCRAFVNMTVICDDINDIINNDEFWHNFHDGESFGLFNKKLASESGRTNEKEYKERSDSIGGNACLEMSLESGEVCNLAEMNLSKFNNYYELLDITKILYKICKHAYLLDCHEKQTKDICMENWRMGLSFTGYLSSSEEQKLWLPRLYKDIREYDKLYVDIMNVLHPEYKMKYSIKMTTIKPSGTLSSSVLGPELCYGAHPAFSKYIKRRMRIASNNDLVNICKNAGYNVYNEERFDGSIDENTKIIDFYLKASDNSVLAENMSAIDQMEIIKRLQTEWSDNSVSCSIYYTLDEIPKIKEYLKKNYNDNFKSLSFLLKENHGFKNPPLEEITEQEYNDGIKNLKDINLSNLGETKEDELYLSNEECKGGSCPIR